MEISVSYKPVKRKTYLTKEKGAYSRYVEDTISSFHKSDIFSDIGIKRSLSEEILRRVGYEIMEEIVSSNVGFSLPENIGTIRIVGIKGFPVDQKLTHEFHKKIVRKNLNTNGIVYRSWFKFNFSAKFLYLRDFKSSFGLRQAISLSIKNRSFLHFSVYNSVRDSVKKIKVL
jgi:hypothetical protein